MDVVEWVCRIGLAVVFTVAGVAKLADRRGTRAALAEFGVPESLVGPAAVAVPVAELAVAAGLVWTPSAWWAAVGALALLLVFSAGIDAALRGGRAPRCHCFGALSAAPVSRRTLARNAALAAPALVVLVTAW